MKNKRYAEEASDLAEFVWGVSSTGHRWIDAAGVFAQNQGSRRFLVPDVRPDAQTRIYYPLRDHSGLFRMFAAIDPSEPRILEFANEFGLLGGSVGVEDVPVKMPDDSEVLMPGETLSKWVDEIRLMSRILLLWDLAMKPDPAGLRKFIIWKKGESVIYNSRPEMRQGSRLDAAHTKGVRVIAGSLHSPEIFTRLQFGDTILPARCYVHQVVEEKVAEHGFRTRLLWDSHFTGPRLKLVPQCLISCLWLQFAKAVEGNKKYRQCEVCNKWFECGGRVGARADKRFCSPTCKAGSHRKKHEEALRLNAKKMAVDEIARRLDTDIGTVKRWVKK